MDGGAWWAAVHGVLKSRTRLSDFTFTFHFHVAKGQGIPRESDFEGQWDLTIELLQDSGKQRPLEGRNKTLCPLELECLMNYG